jgi:hypothetical protein
VATPSSKEDARSSSLSTSYEDEKQTVKAVKEDFINKGLGAYHEEIVKKIKTSEIIPFNAIFIQFFVELLLPYFAYN